MAARNNDAAVFLGLLLGVTIAGAALVTIAKGGATMTDGWVRRVMMRVSKHEGGFDAINPNRDGAGLSYGILQWTQSSGNLGRLLAAMYAANPALFASTFGAFHRALLEATATPGIRTVNGTALWAEPWVSRFKAAGREPAFQAVQSSLATNGDHWRGAMQACRILGVPTERGMALMFDTSVQQGPVRAVEIATWVRSMHPGADARTLLVAYARRAADYFVSDTKLASKPSAEWRLVDGRYHKFALPWGLDLFADVTRRRMGIVEDPSVSDAPVAL